MTWSGEPQRRTQRLAHRFWFAGDDSEVGARSLVGLDATLLPITQGADRNVVSRREVFLAEPKRTPNDLCPRRALHPLHVRFGERAIVRTAERSGMLLRGGHRIKATPIVLCRGFLAVLFMVLASLVWLCLACGDDPHFIASQRVGDNQC